MDLMEPDVITVAVTRVDGGLSVIKVITTEYRPDGKGGRAVNWTVAPTNEYIDSLIAKYDWQGGQRAVSWRVVPNDFVEADRTFRNAWKDNGGARPGHDMPKAREIHRENLRVMRAPLLDQADIEYMRADESNDLLEKRRIAQVKQALRDVTADPRIEAATTPEELKAVIPDALRA